MERLNELADLISKQLFIDQELESVTYTDESKENVIITVSQWIEDGVDGYYKKSSNQFKTDDAFNRFKG